MNARHLLLLVLLLAMVPFPTQAQVISCLPAINDSQPQVLYSLTRTLDGLCEALGGGDYGWVAAGERVFHVLGTEIIEWPIEPLAGKLGTIIAMGDWFGFGAVEPATWGWVKRLYR